MIAAKEAPIVRVAAITIALGWCVLVTCTWLEGEEDESFSFVIEAFFLLLFSSFFVVRRERLNFSFSALLSAIASLMFRFLGVIFGLFPDAFFFTATILLVELSANAVSSFRSRLRLRFRLRLR